MKLLPAGDAAVLVELDGLGAVRELHARLRAARPEGVVDLVPGARTVLVCFDPARTDLAALTGVLSALAAPAAPAALAALAGGGGGASGTTSAGGSGTTSAGGALPEPVLVPVVYDGPDLAEVGSLTGLGAHGVVAAHTGQVWTVAFCGFAPGFGYLVGEDERLHVPRRPTPRTRVPAGSVALAGQFSGVYPRESPGGWHLLGRTDLVVWDPSRDPPALLSPGTRVRFTALP